MRRAPVQSNETTPGDDHEAAVLIAAAKLHVLDLSPIKEKLGDKWPRLSRLVQRLCEAAIKKNQGPRDHFVKEGEFSYIATFHGFSPEEASLACLAIAKEVCELLFGEDVTPVSVRTLAGSIPETLAALTGPDLGLAIAELERSGVAHIVNRKSPACCGLPKKTDPIGEAQRQAAVLGYRFAFAPMWELRKMRSQMLALQLVSLNDENVRKGLSYAAEGNPLLPEIEILSLHLAATYSQRIRRGVQTCATVVGVSYETLARPKTRLNYIAAARSLALGPANTVILKMERVPRGTPLERLAEFIALFKVANLRVGIEFRELGAAPAIDLKLGAVGLGIKLRPCLSSERAYGEIGRLLAGAQSQRLFTFVDGLDSPSFVDVAHRSGANFGVGLELSRRIYDPAADIPKFPLLPAAGLDLQHSAPPVRSDAIKPEGGHGLNAHRPGGLSAGF